MLRHRRQRWAAMDFLLASYRKQKKWIRLRQLLLLLSRIAVAAVLIALLCGWTGGNQMLGVFGGSTTHHVVIVDDSYSMGDTSGGVTAYSRALQSLQNLTRRLANDEGNHQLTVMRTSRAMLTTSGGNDSGDTAADLSAQTITADARLINRVMATVPSSIQTDLSTSVDLAAELIRSTPADAKVLYVASDFRLRDWATPQRIAESLRNVTSDDVSIRFIDCATTEIQNLAVTDLSLVQDVWVAGVPVVVNATIRNYGPRDVSNINLEARVIEYSDELTIADPTLSISGKVDPLPTMVIESLAAGAEVTKTFQVYIATEGTHAVEVELPDDSLSIDNRRVCTLPLTEAEKVLVIDGDVDARGAYHVASVLNPGSQVRIGAIPEIKPPSFLRSASLETLSAYRAVYLINLPEIGNNAAAALDEYVQRGGGLAWFLGDKVSASNYNATLLAEDRRLLPQSLAKIEDLESSSTAKSTDVVFGEDPELLGPLLSAGDASLSLIGLARSWTLETNEATDDNDINQPRVHTVLERRDGVPLVLRHDVQRGRVITVLSGIDGNWTNWPGDPTFVVFLLQANADLWSGASPRTTRIVDEPIERTLPPEAFIPQATYLPAVDEPPRVPLELNAEQSESVESTMQLLLDPKEMAIAGEANVNDMLRPGISEWVLTRSEGQAKVVPVASVIRIGEGDLKRADASAVQQELLPIEVRFLSSEAWSEENQVAGSSTLALYLLALLGLLLAAEQALAYWASYHPPAGTDAGTKRASLLHSGAFSLRDGR